MIEKKITQDTIFDAALAAENFAISVERNLWKESDSRNIEFNKATAKYSRLYAARQFRTGRLLANTEQHLPASPREI